VAKGYITLDKTFHNFHKITLHQQDLFVTVGEIRKIKRTILGILGADGTVYLHKRPFSGYNLLTLLLSPIVSHCSFFF
jgi:hypothetical protein